MKKHTQNGASLLEVMIALFVLAVGLLGILVMQAESIKLNQQAYHRSQALFFANDAVGRMRTNMLALTAAKQAAPSITDVFPEITDWQDDVVSGVPGGTGAVAISGSTFTVTITFPEHALDNENQTEDSRDIIYSLVTIL